jgi:hypothetical protein
MIHAHFDIGLWTLWRSAFADLARHSFVAPFLFPSGLRVLDVERVCYGSL